MAWRLTSSPKALDFLDGLPAPQKRQVQEQLRRIIAAFDAGQIPPKNLDLKKLKGKWKGLWRLRSWQIRLILEIDWDGREIFIYGADYRDSIYS